MQQSLTVSAFRRQAGDFLEGFFEPNNITETESSTLRKKLYFLAPTVGTNAPRPIRQKLGILSVGCEAGSLVDACYIYVCPQQ